MLIILLNWSPNNVARSRKLVNWLNCYTKGIQKPGPLLEVPGQEAQTQKGTDFLSLEPAGVEDVEFVSSCTLQYAVWSQLGTGIQVQNNDEFAKLAWISKMSLMEKSHHIGSQSSFWNYY